MKGDITRSTFDPDKHYTGVRMQQGRVLLDSEWNEQVDIAAYLDETANTDVIGKSGVPSDGGGFQMILVPGDLIITPGRMWVDGVLCESEAGAFAAASLQAVNVVKLAAWPVDASRYVKNLWLQIDGVKTGTNTTVYRRIDSIDANNAAVTFTVNVNLDTVTQVRPVWSYATQPHDPAPAPIPAGDFVVYLDVWTRHLTAVEDPSIREIALGGPDTTTRTQTVWQVRLTQAVTTCKDITSPQHASRMLAQTAPVADPPNPCIVPSQAGYRGLANQLYRVEIHKPGASGVATFKWSRDNGAFVFPVEGPVTGQTTQLRLASLGRDERFGLAANDWVEVIDDRTELQGLPGIFGRVKATPQQNNRIIDLDTLPVVVDFTTIDMKLKPRVRLWSHDPATTPTSGDTKITNNTVTPLESGVEVVFDGTAYVTGEYWLIPARTAINEETGDIQWPRFGNKSIPLPPRGIDHHYAALADFDVAQGTLEDCRPIFSPLTAPDFIYLGGDGQEVMPDLVTKPLVMLDVPLQVGVVNGGPIANALVEFKITKGNGLLNNIAATATITTGADGIAKVNWFVDATTAHQRCEARLVKSNGYDPATAPRIEFNASISIASEVAYDPANCPELKNRNVKTVQGALDAFCDILDDPKLYFVGGDGQEARRTAPELPQTIDVGVADGIRPIGNADVRFTPSNNGKINGAAGPVTVKTNATSGIASVKWELDPAGPESQTATAELLISGNPKGLPVIFKAMFREQGGGGASPCSIVISPGEDVLARIAEVKNDPDVEICFKDGLFEPRGTIIFEKKHCVKITGGGIGTHIVGPDEFVFAFQSCESVILRDLDIEARDGSAETGELVAVGFRDCNDVDIDTVRIITRRASAQLTRAALAFRRTRSFNVQRSDIVAGENAIGILFDEPQRALISENRIGGVQARGLVAWHPRVIRADARPTGGLVVRVGNQQMTADVPDEIQRDLQEAFARVNSSGVTSDRTAVLFFNQLLDDLVKKPEARAGLDRLDRFVTALTEDGRSFAAILARREENLKGTPLEMGSLVIRDNTIHDVQNGIILGQRQDSLATSDRIEHAQISGNDISFEFQGGRGIDLSSPENLHLFANRIEAEQFGALGIHIEGFLGPFAIVRDNQINKCGGGIQFSMGGTPPPQRQWRVINNLVTSATTAYAVAPMILENNVP